jgi:hypothetical protein
MDITCDICERRLTRQGALLFDPPNCGVCCKYHVCYECYFGTILPLIPANRQVDG